MGAADDSIVWRGAIYPQQRPEFLISYFGNRNCQVKLTE